MNDQDFSQSRPTGALPQLTVLEGRYRVERRLGQGGMGAVYLAYDERLDIQCAIKEMSTALLKTDAEREHARLAFHEEAKLLARLSHPNLPRVSDHFSSAGKEYLVMEFVPGETLAQVLQRNPPPWPMRDVLAVAKPLTEVLHYLHTRTPAIIFRDLKPANVMRTPDGEIKLIDFGIARLFKPGQARDTQAFGTIGYCAPEQYGEGQTDARSDVYALAVLLHQLVSGHNPVSQPFNVPAAMRINPAVPEQFSAVLETAMSSDPSARFVSMQAFWRALSQAAESRAPSQPFVAAPSPTLNYPQVQGMARPQSGYHPPTPPQPFVGYGQGPATPQQPFYGPNPPTPPRPLTNPQGPPTPQQPFGYGPSQPTAQRPVSYQPSTLPQMNYSQNPMVAPANYQVPPYDPRLSGPIAESTGLAKTARLLGLIPMCAVIGALLFVDAAPAASNAIAVLALLTVLAGLIVDIVALSARRTHETLKGRKHAVIGLLSSIVTLVLACIVMGIVN